MGIQLLETGGGDKAGGRGSEIVVAVGTALDDHVPDLVQLEDGYRCLVQGAQNTLRHLVLKPQLPGGWVINETRVGIGIIAWLELITVTQNQSQVRVGVGRLLCGGHQQDVGRDLQRDGWIHQEREDGIPGGGEKRISAHDALRQVGERVNGRID